MFDEISLMEFDSRLTQNVIGFRPEGNNFDKASQTIAGWCQDDEQNRLSVKQKDPFPNCELRLPYRLLSSPSRAS